MNINIALMSLINFISHQVKYKMPLCSENLLLSCKLTITAHIHNYICKFSLSHILSDLFNSNTNVASFAIFHGY